MCDLIFPDTITLTKNSPYHDRVTVYCYVSIRLQPLLTRHDILTYLITYLLSPCSRVLEKLIGFQLVKKFLAFYGTRKFINAFTNVRHLSLS